MTYLILSCVALVVGIVMFLWGANAERGLVLFFGMITATIGFLALVALLCSKLITFVSPW